MTVPTLVVLLAAAIGVLVLPRRWVPVPFLLVACYVPKAQTLDLGPLSFTVLRTLTVIALIRMLLRSDWKGARWGASDYLMFIWAALMVGTVALHQDPASQVVGRLGLALDGLGLYLVFRLFCRSEADIIFICTALALLLAPLGLLMVYEKASMHNLLSIFGGLPSAPLIRDGHVRAQGPFRHAILAGTIGALSVPFMAALWRTRRAIAAIGLIACLCIVVSSTSSGPFMSLAIGLASLALWPFRRHIYIARWACVALYLALAVVMSRPPYFLMAKIDVAGGSTGWHRARLIQASLDHLNEWWLAGTDVTRHWMATGVTWSHEQTDVTNHYIALGVLGGLPLLLSFLGVMALAFHHVSQRLRNADAGPASSPFLAWALGSALFTIAITSVSISYFDQSILWVYMTIACCSAIAVDATVQSRVPAAEISVRSAGRTRRHVRQRAASAAVDVARPPASVRTRRRRRVPLQHGDALRSTKR
jgi:hypothetical protein